MTINAEDYLTIVARIPCVLCQRFDIHTHPVTVHHIREGQGISQRADHFLTVALCPDCHQGSRGIHGDRTYLYIAKVTELDLLADTIRRAVRIIDMDARRNV